MLKQLRKFVNEKGQGLTEYVLVIAFIAGVAIMFGNGEGGLLGTLKSAVNRTNELLGLVTGKESTYSTAIKNWGKLPKDELSQIDNKERLGVDEEALANIAGFFIDKDINFIKSILVDPNNSNNKYAANNSDVLLGWYSTDETGGTNFVAKYLQDDHIFNWLQGDYGTYDAATKTIDSNTYELGHDSQTRYLYSDYSINNSYNSTITNENNQKGGIKVKLQYDSSGKTVVAAKVAID